MRWLRRRRERSAPEHEAALPALPEPGAWVQLLVSDQRIDARVDAAVDKTALVVTLRHSGADDSAAVDAPVVMAWTCDDGLVQVDGVVEELDDDGRARIRLEGVQEHLQRRRFVRVPAALNVGLRQPDGTAVRTGTADLSETGMRCLVRGEVVPSPGERLAVTLMLEGEPIALEADVRRVRMAGGRGHEVALQFLEPYPREAIARWLMAAQLRQRAQERE